MTGLARGVFVAMAVGGAAHAFVARAEAAALTPEQQDLVKKYNISAADQKKLFGAKASATKPAQPENAAVKASAVYPVKAPPKAAVGPFNGFLDGTYVWVAADSYKSLGERITNINGGTGALTGSLGAVGGFNTAVGFGDFPVRVQGGASYGVYDFKGRLAIVPNSTETEKQTYYTTGIYMRGDASTGKDPISFGVVYDVFKAKQWGVNASDISLSQVRGILGVAVTESTELGVWGTVGINGDRAAVTVAGAPNLRTPIHAMNQTNFYVKQNFDFGGQVTAYVGVLDGMDIGKWQAGAKGQVPLSAGWSVFADANYVVPRTPAGPFGSGQEQFSVSVGLAYYFGNNAQNPTVTGNRALPLLDVANNRSFLITD